MRRTIAVIPAYRPGNRLLSLLQDLLTELPELDGVRQAAGNAGADDGERSDSGPAACGEACGAIDGVVVVDDGSGEEYARIFEEAKSLGCHVVCHEANRGKGAAIRSGIREALLLYGKSIDVVTADADGQHLPQDILRVAGALRRENSAGPDIDVPLSEEGAEAGANEQSPVEPARARVGSDGGAEAAAKEQPPALVLGVRDLSGGAVPLRSRFGNGLMRMNFLLSTGIRCRDTQTGLRGIPAALLPLALDAEGERYEYEMDFLKKAVKRARLVEVPIETVYEQGNAGSHFRPIRDSLLFYQKPLRFMATAVASNAVDWALFLLFLRLFGISAFSSFGKGAASPGVMASTALARIGSGLFNFQANRLWSFQSRGRAGVQAVRYLVLFFANMLCSAAAVTGLTALGLPAAAGKAAADVTLFIVNYQLQKSWVFRREAPGEGRR